MSPFITTLLMNIAKAAIPVIINNLAQGAKNYLNTIDGQKFLPSDSTDSGSFINFSDIEIQNIYNILNSDDITRSIHKLNENGYSYLLKMENGSKFLEIYKNGKKLVIR